MQEVKKKHQKDPKSFHLHIIFPAAVNHDFYEILLNHHLYVQLWRA